MIHRLFVEKLPPFRQADAALAADLHGSLGLPGLTETRVFLRYDVEGVRAEQWPAVVETVLEEPPVDEAFAETMPDLDGAQLIAV